MRQRRKTESEKELFILPAFHVQTFIHTASAFICFTFSPFWPLFNRNN